MSTNGTANGTEPIIVEDGTPLVVEQGPVWLADILFGPPRAVVLLLSLLVCVGIAVVVLLIVRRDIDRRDVEAMAQNVLTVVGTAAATTVCVRWFSFSYAVDVALGFVVGYSSAIVLRIILSNLLEERLAPLN